jgi:hypothetical protein
VITSARRSVVVALIGGAEALVPATLHKVSEILPGSNIWTLKRDAIPTDLRHVI